jgi:DNA repair exonuclease SbcCD ATPase subunit
MIPRKLTISGFRSFAGEETLTFPKGAGLYFMRGKNEVEPRLSPNASGKSTVWDALSWCVYGKTARGLRAGAIVNWTDSDLCSVELDAIVRDEGWKVLRTQNPNALSIETHHEGPPFAVEQDKVDKLFGMDHTAFLHIVLMGQFNDLFFDLSPAEKLTVFSQALDVQIWKQASEKAKTRAGQYAGRVHELEQEAQLELGKLEQARAQRDKLKEIEAAGHDVDDRSELELGITKEQGQVSREERELSQLAKQRAEHEDARRAAEGEMIERDGTVRQLERDEAQLAEKIAGAERVLAAVKKRASAAGEGGACPTCGSKLKAGQIEKHLSTHQDVREAKYHIRLYSADLETTRGTLAEARKALKGANTRAGAASHAINEGTAKERGIRGKLEAARGRLGELKRKLASITDAANRLMLDIEDARKTVYKLRKRCRELRDALVSEQRLAQQAEQCVRIFKDVRLFVIDEALREYELDVNNSLIELGLEGWSVLFDIERENKSGGVTRGFTVKIKSPTSPDFVPFEAWCGGETQRLRLAGAAGMAALVCRRRGLQTSLEVWDEPTAHLNPQGVEDVLEWLSARAKDDGKQIWVVDHRSLHRGLFDGEVLVRKDVSGSHIVQD